MRTKRSGAMDLWTSKTREGPASVTAPPAEEEKVVEEVVEVQEEDASI